MQSKFFIRTPGDGGVAPVPTTARLSPSSPENERPLGFSYREVGSDDADDVSETGKANVKRL